MNTSTRRLHLRLAAGLLAAALLRPGAASAQTDETDVTSPPTVESPATSPTGHAVLFVSDAAGSRKTLWIADGAGRNARPLAHWLGSIQKDGDWFPDSRRIVFSSNAGGSAFNIWTAEVLASGALGAALRLTHDAGDNDQPRVSPDGTRIAFLSNRTGKRELWIMAADGTGQRAVGLQSLFVSSPTWSPDGQRLAYAGCRRPAPGSALSEGTCNLFASTTDGGVTRQLTTGQHQDWGPDWSPAGIVFSSSRNGGQKLFRLDPSALNPVPQAVPRSGNGLDLRPRWDPGTLKIVFERTGSSSDVWRTDPGGAESRLTAVGGYASRGDVNTDGAIDCADLVLLRSALGRRAGQPGYDLRADVNQDGIVDSRDLGQVARLLPTGTLCR